MTARLLKLLVSLSAAVGVLLAGAWAGDAFAPAALAAKGPPPRASASEPYDSVAEGEIAVGDALVVSGQPMQLSLFYTADSPQRVVLFYAEAFRARGLMPVVSGDEAMPHVSAFDSGDGQQRFISAVPQPDGQTLVMIGLTNPRRPPRLLGGAQAATFPVPEENRAFLGFRSEDQGARAESGQFVSSLPPDAVADFYRRELAAQGWSERKSESRDSFVLFEKSGATLSVALQKLEEKKGSAVFVNRIEGDPR